MRPFWQQLPEALIRREGLGFCLQGRKWSVWPEKATGGVFVPRAGNSILTA